MANIKLIVSFFLSTAFISCTRDTPQNPTLPPNTINTVKDSVWRVIDIKTLIGNGQNFGFEYDDSNRVNKFYMKFSSSGIYEPYYVFYKNGRPSHVIAEAANGLKKASMILLYGSNFKCNKVYYKSEITSGSIDNNNPYFTDLNDGGLVDTYDSITYSATNQISQVFRLQKNILVSATPIDLFKFTYQNNTDSVFRSIENYRYNSGVPFLYDKLLITTNNEDSRVYKQLWFFPFVKSLSRLMSGLLSSSPAQLPIIFDNATTSCDQYLPMLPKCITNYQVYNSWGGSNNVNTQFSYGFFPDSTRWLGSQIAPLTTGRVIYTMKKVKGV